MNRSRERPREAGTCPDLNLNLSPNSPRKGKSASQISLMSGNVRVNIFSLETNLMRHSLARGMSRMILMAAMLMKKKIK
jgi:hypothetical protein